MESLGGQVPVPEYLGTEREVQEFLEYADHYETFAFDTETNGKDFSWKDKVLIMSLACGNRRVCLPSILIPILNPLLLGGKLKDMQNAKFDMHRLANIGIKVADPIFDCAVGSMRENSARPHHDLKYLSKDGLYERYDPRYTDWGTFRDVFGKEDLVMALLNPDNRTKVMGYATMDAWMTGVNADELRRRLIATPNPLVGNQWELYKTIEIPMTRILYEYERAGSLIDVDKMSSLAGPLQQEIDEQSRKVSALAGYPVNLNSPKQLGELFFDKLKYPPVKFTGGGKKGIKSPSLDVDVLEAWLKLPNVNHELVQAVLDSRDAVKQLGTYTTGLRKQLDPFSRLHTSFNQGGARTGRLSSSAPNLQNIPKAFRNLFIAPPGWKVLDFDLEQVELKLAAALSGDEVMIQLFRDGIDVHSKTVEMMEGVPYEEVNEAHKTKKRTPHQQELEDERNDKKRTGFGLLYGETEWKLITQLHKLPSTDRDENLEYARGLQRKWLDRFPGVGKFIERTKAFVSETGYVTTLLGWRRQLPAGKLNFNVPEWELMKQMRSPDWNEACRQAVNSEIQGAAADLMKLIQIRIWRDPDLRSIAFVPQAPVHDELVSTAEDSVAKEALARCLKLATNPQEDMGIHLPVDITADGGIGPNWKEAKG
jgi:DNA polymerase-1